ncbi:Hypothetical predicted protein [Mytilus galloprovincialis]|uniref:Uncharacterized protein n=1 Tax=Mytilus galloprovincialis TaxID=29158 RepID=A0A8B6CAU8_MYTGA|nr:Hypothetical predicted protein [Mytilus galloprovincialis]
METPRRTIRTSTQAPTLSQVRQTCIRSQMFSPADSGLGSSPATDTLHDVQTETMPEVRIGLVATAWIFFPNNQVVQKSQEYVMTGLIVLKGLLVCTIVLKLIWNFVLNGQESDNAPQTWSGKRRRPDHIRRKYMYSTPARTIVNESDTPYDSDEMPSYSCPIPNSPVINGQRHTEMDISGQESENKSTSTKQIQSPDFHNRSN